MLDLRDIFAEGAEAARVILARAYRIVVRKDLDPLSSSDFVTISMQLAKAVHGLTGPAEAVALKQAIAALDVDWKKIGPGGADKVVEAAKQALAPTPALTAKVGEMLKAEGEKIVGATKVHASKQLGFGIAPDYTSQDARVIQTVAFSQAHFIRDEYGKRQDAFGIKAKEIVARGLERGLDRWDIGQELHEQLTAQGYNRSRNYSNLIAGVFANRARTYANLATYHESGITHFTFEAVLDEDTSEVCRLMHGKRFSVQSALKTLTSVEELADPLDVKFAQPWLQVGKGESGQPNIYFKEKDGSRTHVADIDEAAAGKADAVGKYKQQMSDEELAARGIAAPPLHGHCRSTIVADTENISSVVPGFALTPSGEIPAAPARPAGPAYVPPPAEQGALPFGAGGVAPSPLSVLPALAPTAAAPSLPAAFTDPAAKLVWGKDALFEGLPLNGVPIAPAKPGYWEAVADVDVGEPPFVIPRDQAQKKSAGVIVIEPDGRMWLYEPTNHFGGYQHTYPKGTLEKGLSAQQNALKELYEEAGLSAEITGYLGDYAGDTGTTRYYVARRTGGAPWQAHHESQAVKLVPTSEAEKMLNKARDQKVLADLKKKFGNPPKLPEPKAPLVDDGGDEDLPPDMVEYLDAKVTAEQAEEKAIAALNKLPDLSKLAGIKKAPPGYIVHPFASLPLDAKGNPPAPSTFFGEKDIGKLVYAAGKKPAQKVAVADLIAIEPGVSKKRVLDAINAELADRKAPVVVKFEGKLYIYRGLSQATAAELKGETELLAHVVDLDAKAGKPKPAPAAQPAAPKPAPAAQPAAPKPAPAAPKPAPAAPQPDASTILAQQLSGNLGSNAGGFFRGADGVERYVKFYDDPAQAECENLANSIYRSLGFEAPTSIVFEHNGKLAYASEKFPSAQTLGNAGLTKGRAEKVLDGFVADVLLGNWDVVGASNDNVLVLPGEKLMRVDNGGSFLFRAKAGRKEEYLLNEIKEWDVFFSSKNPQYSALAAKAGVKGPADMRDKVVRGIEKVSALRAQHGGWKAYVDATARHLGARDRAKVVDMLEARTKLLEKKRDELLGLGAKPAAPDAGSPRALRWDYDTHSTVAPRAGLTAKDLPKAKVLKHASSPHGHGEYDARYGHDKLPDGSSRSDWKAQIKESTRALGDRELEAIRSFTGSGYTTIRSTEESGMPNDKARAIYDAFGKAQPIACAVYRGVKGIPESVVQQLLTKGYFRLGRGNREASSSASYNLEVALRASFMDGVKDSHSKDSWKILYVLRQKNGMAVEHLSSVGSGEREILIRRDRVFRTTGLSIAEGTKRVLVIEAEEVDDSDASALLKNARAA